MIALLLSLYLASAQSLKIESGMASVQKNEFQVPNSSGTNVALDNASVFYYRFEGDWNWSADHGIRFVIAPFSYEKEMSFTNPVTFDKQTFVPGSLTNIGFKFNSYRLGYVYHWIASSPWKLDIGGTLKIRDARIFVEQNGRREQFTDFGFVPLLYVHAGYEWSDHWMSQLTIDGAGSGQGYAVDALIEAAYRYSPHCLLSIGYRFLDGGADNDTVKTFSTVHYLNLGWRWIL